MYRMMYVSGMPRWGTHHGGSPKLKCILLWHSVHPGDCPCHWQCHAAAVQCGVRMCYARTNALKCPGRERRMRGCCGATASHCGGPWSVLSLMAVSRVCVCSLPRVHFFVHSITAQVAFVARATETSKTCQPTHQIQRLHRQPMHCSEMQLNSNNV